MANPNLNPKADAKMTEAEMQKNDEAAAEAISSATVRLLLKQPFFGALLCDLQRVCTRQFPTMAVDGKYLYYNPEFTLSLNKHEVAGVLCHEVLHLAYLHLTRRRHRNPGKWNAACDFAVNLTVKDEAQMQLPSGLLYDVAFKDMAAEEIYAKLPDKPGKGQGGGKGKGEWDSFDDHITNPDVEESDIVDRVVRAAETARQQGKLPAGIDRLVRKLREPKIDWREYLLATVLDIFNRTDYHSEVRSLVSGPIAQSMGTGSTWLPGLASEESKDLVIVVDTSGSIDAGILKAFSSEIKGVMDLATNTTVMSCDAAVHEEVTVDKFDDIINVVKFKGGGGTDFRPPFDRIAKWEKKPTMLIYFTDGFGTFPDQPDYPVLWAFTKQHAPAPWGDSVTVEDADFGYDF